MKNQRRLMVVAVVVAMLMPAVVNQDGFPLSTYPMYARSRSDVVSIVTASGKTSNEEAVRLSLEVIGASDDPLIVEALLRDAVRAGQTETEALCLQIAGRIEAEDGDDRGLDQVSIVTETHNVVDYTTGRQSLVTSEVHTTCAVPS